MDRRNILIGAAALGGLIGWQTWRRRPRNPVLVSHPHVAGFRTLASQSEPARLSTRGGPAFLVGLEPPGSDDLLPDLADAVADDPLQALYGTAQPPRMAYFTDIRCPICRPFEALLAQLVQETLGLTQITHELPVFGESSILAARALIAAGPAAPQLRQRLQRSPVDLSVEFLAQALAGLDIDPAPILAQIHSEDTDRQLAKSRALADLFGFYGTPALVIGRTAMLGAQPLSVLRFILSDELTG